MRPLPVHNPTSLRRSDFASYYSAAAIRRSRRIMGPYMKEWGYRFPEEWEVEPPSTLHWVEYRAVALVRRAYRRLKVI